MVGKDPSQSPERSALEADTHVGANDPVRAIVAVRARELAIAESNLDEVLDAVERMVTQLGQRRLFIRSQRNIRLMTRVVRVQFQNLRLIEPLEMPDNGGFSTRSQHHYQELAAEFDLQLRQNRLLEKAKLLDMIINKTIVSRSRLTENWLLRLEILLLALFPLFRWLFN